MADVFDIVDRLWRGDVSITGHHPLHGHQDLVEIADGVAFVPSFANASVFSTDDGLVMVDTGSQLTGAAIHQSVRGWSEQPLHTAIFSHGHIDHVFGVGHFEAEDRPLGRHAPRVIAHEHLPARFDRYVMTAGYNQTVNRRQFGAANLVWPTTYRYPDETYVSTHDFTVGATEFQLRHERGETDDATVTWVPTHRVLCCGDLFIWASPNAGNPQKVQRYPREWAGALRRMAALNAEVLLPGHGFPIAGEARVREALESTAAYLESLVSQTLALMNEGARLSDILASVAPPAELAAKPWLQPVYDEPEFIVRNIWRLYGGWWDGNPASLKPATDRALAVELCALSGGPARVAERAESLANVPDDDAQRLAGHLIEMAWLASDDPAIAATRQRIYSARALAATSTMARGVYNWAARESTGEQF